MRLLRIEGESDEEFLHRAEKAAAYAEILTRACLANRRVRELIADGEYSEQQMRRSPVVRVEFDEAIAWGGIGETLYATRNKHWGHGPYILPIEPDDVFYTHRITYAYKPESRYNRRFEQRQRMKELLGKSYRSLVERAKYKRHTLGIFEDSLTADERRVIERIFGVTPQVFRQAARGTKFLDLPPRMIQLELFDESD